MDGVQEVLLRIHWVASDDVASDDVALDDGDEHCCLGVP